MTFGRLILLAFMLVFVQSGCSSVKNIFHHEPHGLLIKDAKTIHPSSLLSDRHIILAADQAQEINRLYGQTIAKDGDLIGYIEAKQRKGRYGDRGHVFLAMATTKEGPIEVLVSVSDGKINQLLLKKEPFVDGKPLVRDKFLFQFIDRSLGDSWELAQGPEDLIQIPAKIRGMEGLPDVSQALVDEIRKMLVYDQVLTRG